MQPENTVREAVLFDLFTVLCGFVTTAVKVLDAWDWLNTMRILRVVRIMRVARIIRKTPSLRELQKLISMMSLGLESTIYKEACEKTDLGVEFGASNDCNQTVSLPRDHAFWEDQRVVSFLP